MNKLTKDQAVIVSGATGVLCCNFEDLHADVSKRLGRPIFTHEFADHGIQDEIKSSYLPDLLAILPDGVRK